MDSYHKIISFPQQFAWKPEIEHPNEKTLANEGHVAVCGMGGSALAGDIIRAWLKRKDLIIHRDFHLPNPLPKIVVAVSYSGNTEEVLTAAQDALEKKIPLFTTASGGMLEALSRDMGIPFIKIPQMFQPREAIGFMIRALTAFIAPHHLKELDALAAISGKYGFAKSKKIAQKLLGKIPLIYSSQNMSVLAYNWKIKLNETGKTPAFTGVVPEIFHNEMTSFDMGKKTRRLAHNFAFILLEDTDDTDEVKKRFRTFKKFIEGKGFVVLHEKLSGDTFMERHVRSINLADWTAYFLAKNSGADSENVPWVEEFKMLNKKVRA